MLDLVVKGLAGCAAAFQFLTRLPIPVKLDYNDALFRRSVIFYPLVGMVLGLLLSLAGGLLQGDLLFAAGLGLGTGVNAALLLLLWVGLTGALHLDGLMDTADGILSHRPREQMLEIMKDSRVGAMGVVACALLMLIKWTLLQQWLTLPQHTFMFILPLVSLWSRWYMVVAIAKWPYARQGQTSGGMGSFFRGLSVKHLFLHTLLALLLSIGLIWLLDGKILSLDGLLIVAVAAIGTLGSGLLISIYLSRKLGGLTGDTYGAMNELLEAVLLLVLYIAVR
ncbi:adenosylcobinamide-GDP ribazoletransferase [Paenibacillus sp. LMG 31456]|uniref:Adenosylcobinamide-GDP ribazoletransferase n=1 Tax=Paenibacillus foliorum TaxID=2654974 RepID=A0A972K0J7_9BACL|nr:adenosylcobinamide-GDP ribazoletransferase [Paenibacillus foliorum]NOU95694.1 adenosylcobinamide-GDP ribazoletransferase [Paenibacillus foliorum]